MKHHILHNHAHQGDSPDFHGMLLVGERNLYLSHLPMFDHPHHRYQALLRVTLTQAGSDPQSVYVSDRRAHPEVKMYTLAPAENFALTDLATHPPRQSFMADIYRGHFERERTLIVENVQVNVEEVIHFRRFEPLTYMLFGTDGELYAAHRIVKPPDFDQVLSVEIAGHTFADHDLGHGVLVAIPERVNDITQRLRPGEIVEAEIETAGEHGHGTLRVNLQVGTEFYFEEGELRFPATMKSTPEEIEAQAA
jgi:hypothetical protein